MPESKDEYWINCYCAECDRWVGAVSKNWDIESQMKTNCKSCRTRFIFPIGKVDSSRFSAKDYWKNIYCPICGRWVAAVSHNFNPKSKMKTRCKPCKVEVVYPAGKANSPNRTIVQESQD